MNDRLQARHLARHLVQVWAFSLAISVLILFLTPEDSYWSALVYSLFIGTCIWAIIDLGRFALRRNANTGWPRGWRGPALIFGGIVGGYLLGMTLGDVWFGWAAWQALAAREHRASILITVVAGVVVSSYFYLRGRNKYFEDRVRQVQAQATEAQLRLLLTQLEPHMLFNTLANLRVLVGIDPPRAQQMLDHLIAYLRATLSASRATEHPLQAEFERLRDYLALMAVRMGPRLDYELQLPPDLKQASIPPLLLQPLVENSIRHGLEPKVEGGRILVTARQEGTAADAMLYITVSDTGVGLHDGPALPPDALPADASPHGHGFGLAQVRERLHTLYGARASVEIGPHQPCGTLVRIRFPLQHLDPSPASVPAIPAHHD